MPAAKRPRRGDDFTNRELEVLVVSLETKVQALRDVLGTSLSWMVQSANTPLRRDEVVQLLARLEKAWPAS